MTIFSIARDFFIALIGSDIAETARGALFADYFGYVIVGLTIYLLVRFAVWLLLYPIKQFKD